VARAVYTGGRNANGATDCARSNRLYFPTDLRGSKCNEGTSGSDGWPLKPTSSRGTAGVRPAACTALRGEQ
jgi:hypothetical protein